VDKDSLLYAPHLRITNESYDLKNRCPVSSPLDQLTDFLADAPLNAEQRVLWRGLCEELMLARVRIQELEMRVKTLDRALPVDDTPSHDILNQPDFNREVARMLAIDARYGGVSSVLYFDIENLGAINDRHGATLVEAALRCIGDTLINQVRRSDIVGRLAKEEFGVLMPRCDNANAWKKGESIASSLFDALCAMWGPNLKPNINFGAYTFAEKEDLASGLQSVASSLTKLVK